MTAGRTGKPRTPEPGETLGLVLAGTFFVVLCAAMVAAGTGTIDDLLLFVLGGELVDTLLTWAAVAAGVVVLVAVVGAKTGGMVAHSRGNLSRRKVMRHERAHRRAFRLAGGGGSRMRVYRAGNGWSGRVTPHSWRRFNRLPRASQAAVYLAGGKAAPDTNCDHDNAAAERILAGAPAREWDEAHRLAARWAR